MIHMNVLWLDELHQAFASMGPAAPAVFESAPWRLADAVRVEHLVDADRPGLDPFGDTASFCGIAGPDAGG